MDYPLLAALTAVGCESEAPGFAEPGGAAR